MTRSSRAAGHSLVELLVVLALMAVTVGISVLAWRSIWARTSSMQAARLLESSVQRARMLAVLRGVHHFVIVDPAERTVRVVSDTGAPFGEFGAGDTVVSSSLWPASVEMSLPAGAGSLPNPLGGSDLTASWTLPAPLGFGGAGAGLRGMMLTPLGTIVSVESSPSLVAAGVVVFADNTGVATSVGIRGQFGTAGWYRYAGNGWKRG